MTKRTLSLLLAILLLLTAFPFSALAEADELPPEEQPQEEETVELDELKYDEPFENDDYSISETEQIVPEMANSYGSLAEITARMTQLQSYFPSGKFWSGGKTESHGPEELLAWRIRGAVIIQKLNALVMAIHALAIHMGEDNAMGLQDS